MKLSLIFLLLVIIINVNSIPVEPSHRMVLGGEQLEDIRKEQQHSGPENPLKMFTEALQTSLDRSDSSSFIRPITTFFNMLSKW